MSLGENALWAYKVLELRSQQLYVPFINEEVCDQVQVAQQS